jgi:predicted AAA+ superfamily ATPase
MYIKRTLEPILHEALARKKSILLLGPRQTGKTTLLHTLKADLTLSFLLPNVRQRYEQNPSILAEEVDALHPRPRAAPLIIVDEVQKVPEIMDVVQFLVDQNKAQFILTGSSARKLRRHHVNLLPGRVLSLHMDPLSYAEYDHGSLQDRCLYGTLPRTVLTSESSQRQQDLVSYVSTYLEEEVRAEALVRNLGRFGRFLELAASESGLVVNFKKLSQKIGVAHTTLMDYYQILEDCLIVERVEPWTESKTRAKLTRSQKYLFFDLGVRRVAAKEGTHPPVATWGHLFEQWVGLELIHRTRLYAPQVSVHFWRDPSGPEVDWVLRQNKRLIPIEVKWTETPTPDDIKHLRIFLKEYPQAGHAYLVCQVTHRRQMEDGITALPWREVQQVFKTLER